MANGGARPGAGRPKGSVSRFTSNYKEALIQVFENIGGVETMTEWAKANKGEFYKIYAHLLPKEVSGPDGDPIQVTRIELVPLSDNGSS